MRTEPRWSLLRRVFRLPSSAERDARAVDDELRFHLEERADELIELGATRDQAVAEVRRKFGSLDAVRDELVALDRRRTRRTTMREHLEQLGQDVGFAIRTLRRRPAFAATAVMTLSLGIGATTAMFSVVDGVLLQPLPFREPGKLVTIYTTFPYWRGRAVVGPLWNTLRTPFPDYVNLIQGQRSFEAIAGFDVAGASFSTGEQTTTIVESSGTANLLPMLGVTPLIGRWFLPGEDGTTAQPLVVLSHAFWQNRFGGDSAVVGRTITVDERSLTIIGVLRPSFSLGAVRVETERRQHADLWVPFGLYPGRLSPNNHTMELIGRLKPNVTLAAALADIGPLLRGNRAPDRRGAALEMRSEVETSDVQRPLLLLFGSVGLLLLITCGNVAMLFLSECTVREPELRTRAVLGAGRARLIRLLLTESAVIAASGAAVGLVIGWWSTRAMIALAPTDLPHAANVGLNARVFAFAVAVGSVVALVSGAVPALTLTRRDAARATGNRVAAGRSRLQSNVIAAQACLSVVLMTGAGLLLRSVVNEQRVDPGFRTNNVLTLRADVPSAIRNRPDRERAFVMLTSALRALPGVERVATAMTVPLSGRVNGQAIAVPPEIKLGQPGSSESERNVVDTAFFGLMGISILAGRAFTAEDRDSSLAVGIVSEGFARRFWPNESALGKQFRSPNGVVTVVGIAADVRNKTLTRQPEQLYYRPRTQDGTASTFLIRTRGDPAALASAAERLIWDMIPGTTVYEVTTLDALFDRALAPGRFRMLLAGIFASLALLLTAVGLAGLTARSVSSRLRELCIRMALGATRRRALTAALSGGVGAVIAGLVAGAVAAPFTARLLSEYLYGISPRDLLTYAATILVALATCSLATIAAARRLREADLATVLRSD